MSFKFSLILPDPSTCQWGRSTDSIPFHLKCLGAAFLFPDIWNMVSPFSGLSDSTFLISSSSAFLLLRSMLFFVNQPHTCCSQEQYKYLGSLLPDFLRPPFFLDKEIEDCNQH